MRATYTLHRRKALKAARLLARELHSILNGRLLSLSLVGSTARGEPYPRDVDVIALLRGDVGPEVLVDLWPAVEKVAELLGLKPLVSTGTYYSIAEPRSLYLMVYSIDDYLEASPILRSMWEKEALTLHGKALARIAGAKARVAPEDLLYERFGVEWCVERAMRGGWSTSILYYGRGTPGRVWMPERPGGEALLARYCRKWVRRHATMIASEARERREYRWEAEAAIEALAKVAASRS